MVILAFVALSLMLFLEYTKLPVRYNDVEKQYVSEIELKLKESLEANPADVIKRLEDITEEYAMDLVVLSEDDIVFANVPYTLGQELLGSRNKDALIIESQGLFDYMDNTYNIWYVIYDMEISYFILGFVQRQFAIVLGTVLVLAGFSLLVQKLLYNPLRNLDTSLQELHDYKFDNIATGSDAVNKKLFGFKERLREDIKTVSRKHTDLEKALLVKRERLFNLITVSRSLIHDVKTPVHADMIENEIYANEHPHEEVSVLAKANIERSKNIILELNTILEILKLESSSATQSIKTFDVAELFLKSLNRFKVSIIDKEIYLDPITPDSLIVNTDETAMTLLIHNLLSNAINHSIKQSEIMVEIFTEVDNVVMIFENESDEENIQRMKDSERIFDSVMNEKNEAIYSSGNGLYLIKDLVSMINGTYEISLNDDRVTIRIAFPIGDLSDDEVS